MTDIRVAAEQARVALPPLPDPAFRFLGCGAMSHGQAIYTEEQMRDYALASLEAALAALPGDKGQNHERVVQWAHDVFNNKLHPINMAHMVEALYHSAATPAVEVPQIAGRDGASAAPSDGEALLDAELGRVAMRFVDRAGDVHPGIDDAETICAEFYAAMLAVLEARIPFRPRQVAHSSQAQGELSVGPVVTNNDRMNEENQNG